MDLRLRPVRLGDEVPFRAAHDALLTEGFSFGFSVAEMAWPDYVQRLADDRLGIGVREGMVPSTFLVAVVGAEMVGRTSIRHSLNDFLLREGGHIGYAVVRHHRRRGYATEILSQSIVVARSIGIDDVLVTCDDDNLGSSTVIERCGGVLESIVEPEAGGVPKRRYWIR